MNPVVFDSWQFLFVSLPFWEEEKGEVKGKTTTQLGRRDYLWVQRPLPSLSVLLRHSLKLSKLYIERWRTLDLLGGKKKKNQEIHEKTLPGAWQSVQSYVLKVELLSRLYKSHLTVLRAKNTGNTSSHRNLLPSHTAEHSTPQHPKKPRSSLGSQGSGLWTPKPEHL